MNSFILLTTGIHLIWTVVRNTASAMGIEPGKQIIP